METCSVDWLGLDKEDEVKVQIRKVRQRVEQAGLLSRIVARNASAKALEKVDELSEKLNGVLKPNYVGMQHGLVAQFFSITIGPNCSFPDHQELLKIVPVERIVKDVRFHAAGKIWQLHRTWRVGGHALDKKFTSNFAAFLTSKLKVTLPGIYRFTTQSDDASWLTVDGNHVVNNTGCHLIPRSQEVVSGRGASYNTAHGSIFLQKGLHTFQVRYVLRKGAALLVAKWSGPDTLEKEKVIPERVFMLAATQTTGPVITHMHCALCFAMSHLCT